MLSCCHLFLCIFPRGLIPFTAVPCDSLLSPLNNNSAHQYIFNMLPNFLHFHLFFTSLAVMLMRCRTCCWCCAADLQPLPSQVQQGLQRVVPGWLMGDSFRGHYPDGPSQPCDVSVSDCRVMNCGVHRRAEQAISMHRCCFPPDHSLQGPPSLAAWRPPREHGSSAVERHCRALCCLQPSAFSSLFLMVIFFPF